MEISLRAYQMGDLWQLNGRLIPTAQTTPYWEYKISPEDSITMLVDGQIEACAGCAYNNGAMELWSAPSKKMVSKHRKEYALRLRKMVDKLRCCHQDVTVHADTSDKKTLRWLRWLGFEDRREIVRWGDLEITVMRISPVKVGN